MSSAPAKTIGSLPHLLAGAGGVRLGGLLLALTLVAGCGGDDADGGGGPEAQPAPGVTTFEEGDFGDVPLPPRSTPVSAQVEEDGVVSQSFEVRNAAPDELLGFYTDALAEFEVLEEPESIGVGSQRGRWEVDGRELTVVAQSAETLDDNPAAPEVITQLSLSLRPVGS